jgi:tetratricopeptide (TPR) repeat protein
MEERLPVNRQQSEARRDRMSIQPLALAAEISGYCDLGMKRESLRLIRRLLEKRRILPEEFGEAVRTIGVYSSFSDFKKWKPKLEAAYNRQSRKFKRKARSDMLGMYASLREWETALQFLSVRKPSSAFEIFLGMGVLLELGKLQDAKVLAARCKRALSTATNRFEQSLLLEALASFFARRHDWDRAISAWQHAPLEEPFRRDALRGIVKIHLARAFEAIDSGLKVLAKLKQNPELSLCLPGNDLQLTQDAEKELLKFKRGIEKVLPEKVRKNLGMSSQRVDDPRPESRF